MSSNPSQARSAESARWSSGTGAGFRSSRPSGALSAATKVTSSLNLPEPEDILIEAGGWRVLVQLLGNGLTLTCVLPADENLGLVKLAMQARGREIREIIDDIV